MHLPSRQDDPKHAGGEWSRRGLYAVPAHSHRHPHPPGIRFGTTAESWEFPDGAPVPPSCQGQDRLRTAGARGKSGLERWVSKVTQRRVTLLLPYDAEKESGLNPHENSLFVSHLVWEVSPQRFRWKGIVDPFFGAT